MDFDQLFPGRFLKSGLFQGKDVTLVIANVRTEELPDDKGGKKVKGIISFVGKTLELVLNRTNGESIKAMFGRKTEKWIGKRVTFWPAPYTDNMTGEVSTAIRVRGSPDIDGNITFELKLARKKAAPVTLLKTTVGAPTHPPAPEEVRAAEADMAANPL